MRFLIATVAILGCLTSHAPATAAAPACPLDRRLRIAGLDWDSARFHASLAAFILRHGFGCKTEIIPGTTVPMLTGLARGDVDIMMEVWTGQLGPAWDKLVRAGKVRAAGVNFEDASEGWYVPRYVVEGPDAPAPKLKSVTDLARYTAVFADREEPGKGRFYNCKLGWDCERVNTKKLEAYGLADAYTNFRTGSGAALQAAIAAAYRRHKPIV